MDQLTRYRTIIKSLMSEFVDIVTRQPRRGGQEVDTYCAFDDERGQYLLMTVGWSGDRRVRGTTLYVRLHDGKFWVEEDWTEDGIATALVRAGVPRHDIVLAFHPPAMRPHTEFAVA